MPAVRIAAAAEEDLKEIWAYAAQHNTEAASKLIKVSRASVNSSAVRALFDLTTPTGGPFPSDRFTTPDPRHNTGLRVTLPTPDCAARPSDCEDLKVAVAL